LLTKYDSMIAFLINFKILFTYYTIVLLYVCKNLWGIVTCN